MISIRKQNPRTICKTQVPRESSWVFRKPWTRSPVNHPLSSKPALNNPPSQIYVPVSLPNTPVTTPPTPSPCTIVIVVHETIRRTRLIRSFVRAALFPTAATPLTLERSQLHLPHPSAGITASWVFPRRQIPGKFASLSGRSLFLFLSILPGLSGPPPSDLLLFLSFSFASTPLHPTTHPVPLSLALCLYLCSFSTSAFGAVTSIDVSPSVVECIFFDEFSARRGGGGGGSPPQADRPPRRVERGQGWSPREQ